MSAIRLILAASLCVFATIDKGNAAESAPRLSTLARMPVKEVTVFKDGHAFVLHEGTMPTNNGAVVMDYLPAPVLGTFFPYTVQKGARLTSVVSGVRRVSVPKTALTMKELIEGNPGAEIHLEEVTGTGINQKTLSYDATIAGVPTRTSEELDETNPPNSDEQLPIKSNLVLLKTAAGTSVVNLDNIQSISFKNGFQSKLSNEEFRNLLNLKLKWDGPPKDTAEVGMVYLQKGLRWIPSYKVNMHADGTADVKLQATLVNELVDLNDVNANLVIGVPTFAFADNTDPIAIQNVAAQLSQHFRSGSQTQNAFSNAIMSQAPMLQGATNGTIGPQYGDAFVSDSEQQPEVASTAKSEDLFIFTASHITLKKGQRMIVPIAEYQMKYKDVYTLTMPFSPPPDVHMYHTPSRQELAKAFNAPKVMHNIRLSNKSSQPLTTAPVLILKDEKLIAQGMSTYTAPNSSCDVTLTTAVDVKVKKTDREIKRTNDMRIDDKAYSRVDLEGNIELTNFSQKPLEVEVKRFVLGKIASADHGGKVEMINVFEDADSATEQNSSFVWWNWYQWPGWWKSVNGMGKGTWSVTLAPRTPTNLNYKWSYFWR